jgi:hypothetical protein
MTHPADIARRQIRDRLAIIAGRYKAAEAARDTDGMRAAIVAYRAALDAFKRHVEGERERWLLEESERHRPPIVRRPPTPDHERIRDVKWLPEDGDDAA